MKRNIHLNIIYHHSKLWLMSPEKSPSLSSFGFVISVELHCWGSALCHRPRIRMCGPLLVSFLELWTTVVLICLQHRQVYPHPISIRCMWRCAVGNILLPPASLFSGRTQHGSALPCELLRCRAKGVFVAKSRLCKTSTSASWMLLYLPLTRPPPPPPPPSPPPCWGIWPGPVWLQRRRPGARWWADDAG